MSLLSRALGMAGRASVVAVGAAVASTVLVGIDQRRGAIPAVPDHPGPYSPEEREAAVRMYLTALTVPAAAFRVPFAKDCVRRENGLKTGFGADQLRWDLHLHLQYSVIREVRDIVITVDPPGREGVVHADFTLATVVGATARVSEDFVVPTEDCLIHSIEARVSLG
ncbi:hypothetical protein SAMN06265174_10221 [Dietzia kunjamensis subsp. schimae]|uniref:DUF8021 domain-containing protein n=2 Tax=Dietzia TaxID=37914 RepID=A0A365PDZ0_9ACTN|nr:MULTISPECIES: hypothetical protein [Dietzia]MBB1015260.1 hypothetical protein [Dietzia kunjamensis subsp. schimae]MEB8327485.1 hypothetical protein [Dietzia kunjamensis]RBA39842.1 hypothetical protein DQ226_02895 [Dietzia maris]SMO50939.1 hypothetical protein SAMN06265174_10221 [Dietzia kunjamensis subsp. schimae]